jgi:hypothetical protein
MEGILNGNALHWLLAHQLSAVCGFRGRGFTDILTHVQFIFLCPQNDISFFAVNHEPTVKRKIKIYFSNSEKQNM